MAEISETSEMKENIPPEMQSRRNSVKRSRNISGPINETKWERETALIYGDMGVEPISSENSWDSLGVGYETTPMVTVRRDLNILQPNAPQVLREIPVSSIVGINQSKREISITPLKPIKDILRNDDNFLCRRVKDVIEGEDHFSKLSDEIILCILRWIPKFFLARCATVCKKWSRVILDESIWRRMDLSNKAIKPGVLGRVLSRGVCVLRLSKAEISEPIFLTQPHTFFFPHRLRKLQYLDLSMAVICDDGLTVLLSLCKDLKKLSLENCSLNVKICNYIGENEGLEVLNLCMCRGITIDCAMAILTKCVRIRALNIAWTNLDSHTIMYIATCLPPVLTRLNISGCRENMSDDDVTRIVDRCPGLKELDISDSTTITGNCLSFIARHLHNLEYLALSRCYLITFGNLPVLLSMSSLQGLDVFGMLTEDGLHNLRELMPRLSINTFPLSSIARPTTGMRRTSIWGLRVRDSLN